MTMLVNPYIIGVVVPFDYNNAFGSGDRTGSLTVTALDFSPNAGDVTNIVNGSLSADASGAMRFPTGGADRTISIVFPSPVEIEEYNVLSGSSTANGDWTIQDQLAGSGFNASINGFTWNNTNIIAPSIAIRPLDELLLQKVGGSTNSTVWFLEINFKIRPA